MDKRLYQRRRSLGAGLKNRTNPQIPSIAEGVELMTPTYQRSSSSASDSRVMFSIERSPPPFFPPEPTKVVFALNTDEEHNGVDSHEVNDNLAAIRSVLRNSDVSVNPSNVKNNQLTRQGHINYLDLPAWKRGNSHHEDDLYDDDTYVVSPGYMSPEPPEDEDGDEDSETTEELPIRFQEKD